MRDALLQLAFNRTSLELKPLPAGERGNGIAAFNRTSLELKLSHVMRFDFYGVLLIAPVWN